MARKVRHIVNRSGRHHARRWIPKHLRKIVGKTELRAPLGGDSRTALKVLPSAVAQMQHQIALAERKAGQPGTMAHYPRVGIDDGLVSHLRHAIAGRASDAQLAHLNEVWAKTISCPVAKVSG